MPPDPTPVPAGTRGVGGTRHVTSLLMALVLVPAGLVLLDYATSRAVGGIAIGDDSVPSKALLAMAVGAGCLAVSAAAGRMSALGPFVAGLVFGVAPTLWVYFDYSSYADVVADLPDDAYANIGLGLLGSGFAVYPAVAGLLLGIGLAGRWRRPAAKY